MTQSAFNLYTSWLCISYLA